MRAVSPEGEALLGYLRRMRGQGYAIAALEQTGSSRRSGSGARVVFGFSRTASAKTR